MIRYRKDPPQTEATQLRLRCNVLSFPEYLIHQVYIGNPLLTQEEENSQGCGERKGALWVPPHPPKHNWSLCVKWQDTPDGGGKELLQRHLHHFLKHLWSATHSIDDHRVVSSLSSAGTLVRNQGSRTTVGKTERAVKWIMPCMPIFLKGEPGFIGPQGEPGLPGLPGTKVSRPLCPSFFSDICAIPAKNKRWEDSSTLWTAKYFCLRTKAAWSTY